MSLINLYPALRNKVSGSAYGYINDKGNFIIKPKYQNAYDFNEFGTAVVEKNNVMGIINLRGDYVVKPIYDSISPYKEGRAVYVLKGSMGVMDERGKAITKKAYNFIGDYNEGRAVFGVNNPEGDYVYGYLDRYGKEIVSPRFLEATEFNDGVALVKSKTKEYGLISRDGRLTNKYKYGYVSQYGDRALIFADSINGPFGYINKKGEVIIEPIYKMANGFKDGLAVVSTENVYNSKYGAINLKGSYVYQPIYSEINPLGEGRFALGKPIGDPKNIGSNVYAIGDTTDKRLTGFEYLVVGSYERGLSYVSNNLSTFFIDKKGRIVKGLPVARGSGTLRLKNNIILADIDYSPYYLDKLGKVIYKPNDIIVLSHKYSVKRVKYKPNINYLIYLPKVRGVADRNVEKGINIKLTQMSYFKPEESAKSPLSITPEDVLDYIYYGDFSVQFFKLHLLVLDITGYYYPLHAAHGMPSKKTPNIDLVTGQFYSLGDLFMSGVYWTGELNKIIENMIETDPQYEDVFKDAFKGIAIDQSFYVDKNNLYIYFSPYEIGPYVAGFITFKIPFTEIEGMINKQGNFYKAFST